LGDGAVLFFDVGSESRTDDHALVVDRVRISRPVIVAIDRRTIPSMVPTGHDGVS
jgi:hypothetical protein